MNIFKMRSLSLLLLLFGYTLMSFSQSGSYSITGRVVENFSENPIAFATIVVLNKTTNVSLAGTTSDMDGNFELKFDSEDIAIEVSFIGFETVRINEISITDGVADLGVIKLTEGQTLEVVEIRAEKSTTEFRLDRRVFNVGKDLSSTGMGAMELLNNVPSVNVSIEGQISLRGSSGVQILIDGKPSILTDDPNNSLSSITAEMIESVEVITNPSAKYDAEGTSGIINIILKKDEKKGVN